MQYPGRMNNGRLFYLVKDLRTRSHKWKIMSGMRKKYFKRVVLIWNALLARLVEMGSIVVFKGNWINIWWSKISKGSVVDVENLRVKMVVHA